MIYDGVRFSASQVRSSPADSRGGPVEAEQAPRRGLRRRASGAGFSARSRVQLSRAPRMVASRGKGSAVARRARHGVLARKSIEESFGLRPRQAPLDERAVHPQDRRRDALREGGSVFPREHPGSLRQGGEGKDPLAPPREDRDARGSRRKVGSVRSRAAFRKRGRRCSPHARRAPRDRRAGGTDPVLGRRSHGGRDSKRRSRKWGRIRGSRERRSFSRSGRRSPARSTVPISRDSRSSGDGLGCSTFSKGRKGTPREADRDGRLSRGRREFPETMAVTKKLNVLLVVGGDSAERDVSIESGASVFRALRELGHRVVVTDPLHPEIPASEDPASFFGGSGIGAEPPRLGRERFAARRRFIGTLGVFDALDCDIVFNCLHGGAGEDGTFQAVLDYLGIPYTGSGACASMLAMDKSLSKRIVSRDHVPVAQGAPRRPAEPRPRRDREPRDENAVAARGGQAQLRRFERRRDARSHTGGARRRDSRGVVVRRFVPDRGIHRGHASSPRRCSTASSSR